MITFYDYLPSQNGWKVRQLLRHLQMPYRTEIVSIFEGRGQTPDYLAINPTGAVPAIRLEDGRVLAESNAILCYLAHGTAYRPTDPFADAKVLQWLSFEADYVQSTIGSLRYWTLTGKRPARPAMLVNSKEAAGQKALAILDRELGTRPFVAGDSYSIADISVFAYAHLAADAGISTAPYPHFEAWIDRVRVQPGFLDEEYAYAIDPHASVELP
ncbi:MAG TPA: glutathione S-transferase family protein [Aliidongia sp.]|uniref:glutathione S-transferase family protein n=1 Tax=Aliidongia sp. TaxID=1914230 RepID=UPI002DDD577A|nr:glutathione S-transferase family protein [Aliidongia sp.]HEV2678061.1 glutathione S-transferase family protein [Aliidongia sp.]